MYCDDSSVKAVDPKQVVVSTRFPSLLLLGSYTSSYHRTKRHTCCSIKEFDHRVYIQLFSLF
jgi:hypothetical protein